MKASFSSRPEPLGSGRLGARASTVAKESPAVRSAWDGWLAGLLIVAITAVLIGPLVVGDLRPLQAGLFLLGLYILRVTAAAV